MRTLKFNVNGQIIEKDPNCDFSNLVPGTNGYLQGEFNFSKEWRDYVKVAAFFSGGIEYEPQILDGNTCYIPADACARPAFKIQILGRSSDNDTIKTNTVIVNQNGGRG